MHFIPGLRPALTLLALAVGSLVVTTGTATASPDTTPVACDLLTPAIATAFVGDDAERQRSLGDDNACLYLGNAGSVFVSINPLPTNPDAPVNHFSVLRPVNAIPDLGYQAYWFAAGQSVVVVKGGLLLEFKVSDRAGVADRQELAQLDITLADQIVPKVG